MAALCQSYSLTLLVFRMSCLQLRRLCAASVAEAVSDNGKMTREARRRMRAEGIRRHAVYHLKVNEIAAELRLKRLEEEKREQAMNKEKERLIQLEKDAHERIIESVKLENEILEQMRKERYEEKAQKREENAQKREEARKRKQESLHEMRRQNVLRAIEESKTWVTRENLEEKIADCLENETNYNFALSPTGEKHYSVTPPGCIDTEDGPGDAAYF